MKLQDKETLNVAEAVKNVLEGKVKEEAKYPHDMFHPETGEKEVAKNEDEHKALSKKGYTHEKPDVDEVAEPEAKGEKEFKSKHTVKKTGTDDNAKVTKEEVTITIDEAKLKAGKGKATVDVDFIGDKDDAKAAEKKFNIKIKMGRGTADVTGEKKNIIAWLSSDMYGMDSDDIEDIFPELTEATSKKEGNAFGKAVMAAKDKGEKTFVFAGKKYDVTTKEEIEDEDDDDEEKVDEELSAKQKKYQAFFAKALKKFGVDSPSELEGDKKKEFFDYIDANYEADNEVEESIEVEEGTITVKDFTGKAPAGIKMKKIGSGRYGGDDVTMTGDDKKLIAYAVRSLGVNKNKVKDIKSLQKEIDANG